MRALVLAPTKELVQQIGELLVGLTKDCGGERNVRCRTVTSKKDAQSKLGRGAAPDVVVAVPGSVVEFAAVLKDVEMLVIDEADLVLSYGFEHDIRTVKEALPAKCHTCVALCRSLSRF